MMGTQVLCLIQVIAHRGPACGRLDSLRQDPSPQEAQRKQLDLPKVKGMLREKEVSQLFFKEHAPLNKVTLLRLHSDNTVKRSCRNKSDA